MICISILLLVPTAFTIKFHNMDTKNISMFKRYLEGLSGTLDQGNISEFVRKSGTIEPYEHLV